MTFTPDLNTVALALVESPAQLLNVIELAQHEDDFAGLKIAVLAPARVSRVTNCDRWWRLRAMPAIRSPGMSHVRAGWLLLAAYGPWLTS